MLETFNPVVRPIAAKYDPLSVVRAAELPPLFSLSAIPGQRRSRQPLRVALNARFRLPAGEYEVTVKGSDEAGTVPQSDAGPPNRPGRLAARDVAAAAHSGGVSQHRFRYRSMQSSSDFARPVRWSEQSRSCGSERSRS